MPKKRKKAQVEDDDLDLDSEKPSTEKAPSGGDAEDDYDLSALPSISDSTGTNEPDPREVDNLTDRIFDSVLSRYGWKSQDGRIEHVGEVPLHRR
jgi:hypothetical protein